MGKEKEDFDHGIGDPRCLVFLVREPKGAES